MRAHNEQDRLIQQLADLQRRHADEIKPIMGRLIELRNLELPRPVTLSSEGLSSDEIAQILGVKT